ncbi:DegT/DnrJ/EryC1/StrS aminotransferase family protein [Rothia nasimurium]|uniref:DegT/DnrJ/EryC1/StrS family aminotransferase n=1 Tax=Luteibacter anthropi TaxID=564369 RepID=A0A7X5UEH6_9GAMM|nr:DegT/DnrJ/EryC1/StrS family aminotransferase [Luteibacter anthropi]NII08971.1 DegT/DnrJ/EryC1/StrS family aminotransferase [Luteibacter anthropi]
MSAPPKIHYTKPSITALETAYAADAATHGWGERCYEYIDRFERAFAAHIGTRHAIATSSATGALHLGMAAMGIGRGDEVILADINWIASAAPVVHLGATPVFVDVTPDGWCLDTQAVLRAITPRTKAILAVHLYGNLCDMDSLRQIGKEHGIAVIEDAAEAIGSMWQDRRAGSMGAFGAFSFHGTKTITTGEGGMFVTNDDALYRRVLTLSNHGRASGEPRQFWPAQIGFKYKISNIQAAIGCAQLERVEELVAAKRHIFDYYRENLSDLGLPMNPEPAGTRNGYWMPTVVFPEHMAFHRDILLSRFRESNIDGRVFFWPLSSLPMFDDVPENVVSRAIAPRAINLPSYHDLTRQDQDRVIACLRSALAEMQ